MDLVWVGVGGFAGAIARYVIDGAVADLTQTSAFPWGTLVVNLSGAFLLGVLTTVIVDRAALPAELRGPVLIGFIGAYTTFSTLMLESWRLVEAGSYGLAVANLAGSVGLGLAAVFAGLVIGRAI
ncbi:MAG TPA: fluoride efflux transporter CrcB [Candidatus Limnocylindrales bacterium]|jgi:CrcB protein